MRTVKYRTHWSYLGPAIKHEEPLSEFILDILYLMEDSGVIPPLTVLNQILSGGGDNGGMGPGTTWRRFTIKQAEYEELVEALLQLDVEEARKKHPYVTFEKVIVDHELDNCTTHVSISTTSRGTLRGLRPEGSGSILGSLSERERCSRGVT